MYDLDAAYRMLDIFQSLGAKRFGVTFLDMDGEKCGFRKDQSAAQIKNSLPKLMPGLTERKQSIVIRPHSDLTLIQLDDLDAQKLERVFSASALTCCTSEGNHQAWVAVSGLGEAEGKDLARRLRKGVGADISASGASRLSGTLNFKRKYGPDFPMVKIVSSTPGRIMTPQEIEALGLLAPPEPVRASAPIRVFADRSWPDYERCVQGAPLNHEQTGPDISRADFFFSMLSAQRGWSPESVADRLMQLSSKAKENGEGYAMRTALKAAATAEAGRQRGRG